ncbi:D-amino-acid transaminase [Pueribacillus theae]|uniref:D-alanine aminotransferase n=1 Tax=Pueribacillus theae TaxID=2171751 RepID=A0A2U1K5N2_9BACI|nr:D-amino-acid transaminase [Pueribacillus theae]PWA12830.1 D-amino-acid transaminase [Pueribacillus theae]
MGKVIVNDQMMERSQHRIDMEDRGYQFGDGVYEVIRVYNGDLFGVEEHIDRFFESAGKIKLKILFTKESLKENLNALIKENELQLGIVYMQLTRGVSPRAHVFPDEHTTPVLTAYTKEMPIPKLQMANGVSAIVTPDIRWLRCDIKSLNLLPNILAKEEAKEQGCYEAIFHRDGIVTEGASSNIFIVAKGNMITHPESHFILNGITRQMIFKLCKENKLSLVEKPFNVDDLMNADEVFLSSTVSEVMPIVKIDNKTIGNGQPGPHTKQLQALFQKYIQKQARITY